MPRGVQTEVSLRFGRAGSNRSNAAGVKPDQLKQRGRGRLGRGVKLRAQHAYTDLILTERLNGLITNDKFCLSRIVCLPLGRRPSRRTSDIRQPDQH